MEIPQRLFVQQCYVADYSVYSIIDWKNCFNFCTEFSMKKIHLVPTGWIYSSASNSHAVLLPQKYIDISIQYCLRLRQAKSLTCSRTWSISQWATYPFENQSSSRT